ncbi:MAG: PrsW family glutamic-type intramembrane protease [bacterium]|nr:PrsW family glutamic-type intramembrane protease [bacterium]
MINDPKVLVLSLVAGIIPSFLWLWFWLKEDKKKPEPKELLAIVFVMGMIAVIFVLPIQKFIRASVDSDAWQLVLWASAEEIIKYIAVLVVLLGTTQVDEPIDWPIYLITAALGFAALENTLFLREPFSLNNTTIGLLTGQLRFLGSTLLHTVTSGMVGMMLGLSFHLGGIKKKLYLLFGLIFAIALHSAFNFFIIRDNGNDFLRVFSFLWVVTIIIMLLFEKLRRMT